MKKALITLAMLALVACSTSSVLAEETKPADAAPKVEAKPYPINTCIVSGEKLGEMGKIPSIVYKGQEIKFCCKDCVKDFNKDPEKFMKKLAKEEKKAASKK